MQYEEKEKIRLTVKEILFYLLDGCVYIEEIFNPKSRFYFSKSYDEYLKARNIDKVNFSQKLYRLNRQKYIKIYFNGKNKHVELVSKGIRKIRKYMLDEMQIPKKQKWDKKWRIVIFDIPEEKRTTRNLLAKTLKRLYFIPLQKSVYVYPFECFEEINQIRLMLNCKKHIQYIVADRIETEINLIKNFFDEKILINDN